MTAINLDAVVAEIDPNGCGGRRHVDQVAAAIRKLAVDVEAASIPQLVLDTIRRGEVEGRWSATTTATELRGSVKLPKSVLVQRSTQPREHRRHVSVPLRPELSSWAATLLLNETQRSLVMAVNEWLKRTDGGNTPIVAAAERAYELVQDEKAFDTSPPRGGATLWRPDRLTFELLRCQRIATPLTWEPVNSVPHDAGPVLCVENHATFRTLLRVLRQLAEPPWVAVAWIQGRNVKPLASLPDLPFRVARLDYLGDLDAAGLDIAARACATAEATGVPAGPADRLWKLLVSRPRRPDRPLPKSRADQLATWLPDACRQAAIDLMSAGQAIPQEALRYDVLMDALAIEVPMR